MPQRLFPLFLLLLKAVSGSGQPLAVTVINVSNTTCQYNNGSFVVKATGGASPYVYASSAARQSNTTGIFAELVAGSYDILVTDADPTAAITRNITYTVTALAPDGCSASDSIAIIAYAVADIIVPKAFTPNGDGHNDVLRVIPSGIRDFHYFNVYNRWGQQIFSTANPAIGWGGWRGPGAVGVGFSRKFGICLSSLRHPYKALVIFRKSSYW